MRFRGVTVCLIGMLFLCGCHGLRKTEEFVVPDEFDTSRQYTITFWAKNDTNKYQTDIYKKAIEDFQALYPNVTVDLRLYTDYGRIYNDVITNISTGTTPNVCITYPDHIATYLTGENQVVPLDDLMEDERYGFGGSEVLFDSPQKSEVVAKFLEEGKIGGYQYALPFMRSTEACYINKTYVEKLGYQLPEKLTWDFLWEVSEKAMEKNGDGTYKVNGQKVLIPFIYKSTDNMMIQYLRQSGAGYSTPLGEIRLFNDVTGEFLCEIAAHAKSGAFSTFKISSYPANFLNAGQCIFAIDSTAGATWMGTDAPLLDISEDALVDFETVVMPIPQVDVKKPQMISQGPSVCIFNKPDSGEVLASWLFAQYLLTNEVQVAYAQTEGYIPVTKKAMNSPEYQEYLSQEGVDNKEHYAIKIQASRLLLEHIDDTFVTNVFNGSASLRDASGALIENISKHVRRNGVVDEEYLETLYSDVTSLYHLDQIKSDSFDGKAALGKLPIESVVLLTSLAVVWILMIIYVGVKSRK